MPDRILLVEDDADLGAQVVNRLEQAGYRVTWWRDGSSLDPHAPPQVELVILDLMLPGTSGLDILQELRAVSEVPIMVLSARNHANDRVRALQLGADDYMTKPFWPGELIERVKARLRRPALQRTDALVVGIVHIDLVTGQVQVAGRPVTLTAVELRFLTALARRPGVPVSRTWLAENVLLDDREAAIRTLDVHASRLRKKLGRPELVETVFGVGYRLARCNG